jgi:hypothetical protein
VSPQPHWAGRIPDPNTGGGATTLTDLTDVTGTPGPGHAPVDDGSSTFVLTPVTTQQDLDNVLNSVAAVTWHNVGDPGEPPFQSQFRNIGDPWSPCRFRILANSTVRLQGTITCDDQTIADSTWLNIFDLPPEAAAGYSLEFAILTNDNAISKLFIWENGQVIWGGYTGIGPTTHAPISRLPVNGITWSTAQPIPTP